MSCFNFGFLPNLTLGAMFPGRWPNYPESMWNYGWSAPSFSSPQPAVPPGQFCGSDMMSQQSQAQSQAQTQAQLAHLREQNSILNQQLASQAQTHIQHLQQLLPFHHPYPLHIHLSLHPQHRNHQHRLQLNLHHLDPAHPSAQKR